VLRHRIEVAFHELGTVGTRLESAKPDLEALEGQRGTFAERLRLAASLYLERRVQILSKLSAHLAHLNPQAVLERGYSIVTTEDGTIVRDSAPLRPGQRVGLAFAKGRAGARIEDKS
jgi:exodeoxyribonuclease VII large subunit